MSFCILPGDEAQTFYSGRTVSGPPPLHSYRMKARISASCVGGAAKGRGVVRRPRNCLVHFFSSGETHRLKNVAAPRWQLAARNSCLGCAGWCRQSYKMQSRMRVSCNTTSSNHSTLLPQKYAERYSSQGRRSQQNSVSLRPVRSRP